MWARRIVSALLSALSFGGLAAADASALTVFSTDFNAAVPGQFTGAGVLASVSGYSGLGTGSNVFGGSFLFNDSFPAAATTLVLTGLPAHTTVDLKFLLAMIDTWDGNTPPPGTSVAPDTFNVRVDGVLIFSATFDNQGDGADQGYVAPAGVQLTTRPYTDLGVGQPRGFPQPNEYGDGAYDMGLDPTFLGIPHTASTLTVQWLAGGSGWQGGIDESWAIDNVTIELNGVVVVPEPASLLGPCLLAAAAAAARRRAKPHASRESAEGDSWRPSR